MSYITVKSILDECVLETFGFHFTSVYAEHKTRTDVLLVISQIMYIMHYTLSNKCENSLIGSDSAHTSISHIITTCLTLWSPPPLLPYPLWPIKIQTPQDLWKCMVHVWHTFIAHSFWLCGMVHFLLKESHCHLGFLFPLKVARTWAATVHVIIVFVYQWVNSD